MIASTSSPDRPVMVTLVAIVLSWLPLFLSSPWRLIRSNVSFIREVNNRFGREDGFEKHGSGKDVCLAIISKTNEVYPDLLFIDINEAPLLPCDTPSYQLLTCCSLAQLAHLLNYRRGLGRSQGWGKSGSDKREHEGQVRSHGARRRQEGCYKCWICYLGFDWIKCWIFLILPRYKVFVMVGLLLPTWHHIQALI